MKEFKSQLWSRYFGVAIMQIILFCCIIKRYKIFTNYSHFFKMTGPRKIVSFFDLERREQQEKLIASMAIILNSLSTSSFIFSKSSFNVSHNLLEELIIMYNADKNILLFSSIQLYQKHHIKTLSDK